jgi:hypothetical protein
MGLQRKTIQKLLRDNFPGDSPIVVDAQQRSKVADAIRARLERIDGVDAKEPGYVPPEQKRYLVASFSLIDPGPYYYHYGRSTFYLRLDDDQRLTMADGYSGTAVLVSDLEEIGQFVHQCKERLERQRALQAKRTKVRHLLVQAILAQVKKLAQQERFDFMSESDLHKLKLYVKLSAEHALTLDIPFRRFKQVLPQLRSTLRALRQLYESGIRFHIVSRRGLPWRQKWIEYQSLAAEAPDPDDEGSAADGDSD